jgi:hypothetical protein
MIAMKFYYLSLLLLIMTFSKAFSQDLAEYRWENRILLLIADEIENEDVDRQISEIRASTEQLEERKLVTFLLTKEKSYMGYSFEELLSNPSLFKKYKVTQAPFEMVLIGLDGGVKERYTAYQPLEDIFALIDGMPMRRAELRKKGE